MGDYINAALTTWRDFQQWTPPTSLFYPMLALSLACAFIISMFTAAPRLFTVPIGFMILMFSATLSNFLARGLFLSGITELQKTMMFTILGNSIACIVILAFFKVSERR
jgi:hypothetical protein